MKFGRLARAMVRRTAGTRCTWPVRACRSSARRSASGCWRSSAAGHPGHGHPRRSRHRRPAVHRPQRRQAGRRAARGGRGRHALVAAEGPRDVPGHPPGAVGAARRASGVATRCSEGRPRPRTATSTRSSRPSTSRCPRSARSPRRSTRTAWPPPRLPSSAGTSRTSTSLDDEDTAAPTADAA